MTYIFVFLGEFGYELFNWQGAIRKLRSRLPADGHIVCCSRASLYPLYEFCDAYVDISNVGAFPHSRAMAYFALPAPYSSWDSVAARRFNQRLEAELKAHILAELQDQGHDLDPAACQFVFSSDRVVIAGVKYGRPRHGPAVVLAATGVELMRRFFPSQSDRLEDVKAGILQRFRGLDHNRQANIYDLLDLENNHYVRIQPDLSIQDEVLSRLGWQEPRPFILCQTRHRDTKPRSPDLLPVASIDSLLRALAAEVSVVLLSFHTGRWLDSYSTFDDPVNFISYHCRSFPEQACLIHMASHCLFFTEGDFGSHIYVPPFMGKDVTAIAPESVYDLGTTPIEFWNQAVFTFGGQIRPVVAEQALATPERTLAFARELLASFESPALAKCHHSVSA